MDDQAVRRILEHGLQWKTDSCPGSDWTTATHRAQPNRFPTGFRATSFGGRIMGAPSGGWESSRSAISKEAYALRLESLGIVVGEVAESALATLAI